jgi:hypothetical protein
MRIGIDLGGTKIESTFTPFHAVSRNTVKA